MHPLAAIILGILFIATGFSGLAWYAATTINRNATWDLIDEEHHRLIWEEQQRV